jgi:hypothetical protein
MALYTFIGPRNPEDWEVTTISVPNAAGTVAVDVERGESVDIEPSVLSRLAEDYKFERGEGHAPDPVVNPFKGEKGDKGDPGIGLTSIGALPGNDLGVGFGVPQSGDPATPWDKWVKWAGAYPILLVVRAAVISEPGQNGHIYLETAPPLAPDTGADAAAGKVRTWGYVACRNNSPRVAADSAGTITEEIASGCSLVGIVPAGWYYRLRTHTVAGFQTPTFVLDTSNNAILGRIG